MGSCLGGCCDPPSGAKVVQPPGAGGGHDAWTEPGTQRRSGDYLGVARPRHLWQPDDSASACSWCGEAFTWRRRRHHCRSCGHLRCSNCSSREQLLVPDDGGQAELMRVCDECFEALPQSPGAIADSYSGSQAATSPRSAIQRPDRLMPRSQWQPDSDAARCNVCDSVFDFTNRRHHCRMCGLVVCGNCFGHSRYLQAESGLRVQSRVCTNCRGPSRHVHFKGDADRSRRSSSAFAESARTPPVTPFGEPPDWVPDESQDACAQCCEPFTLTRRRHHCRACGRIFCSSCSQTRMRLGEGSSHLGLSRSPSALSRSTSNFSRIGDAVRRLTGSGAVRVCDGCALAIGPDRRPPVPTTVGPDEPLDLPPAVAWMEGEWAGARLHYSIVRDGGGLLFIQSGAAQAPLLPAAGTGPTGWRAEAAAMVGRNDSGEILEVWFRRQARQLLSVTTRDGVPAGVQIRCDRVGGPAPPPSSNGGPPAPAPDPAGPQSPDAEWDMISPPNAPYGGKRDGSGVRHH